MAGFATKDKSKVAINLGSKESETSKGFTDAFWHEQGHIADNVNDINDTEARENYANKFAAAGGFSTAVNDFLFRSKENDFTNQTISTYKANNTAQLNTNNAFVNTLQPNNLDFKVYDNGNGFDIVNDKVQESYAYVGDNNKASYVLDTQRSKDLQNGKTDPTQGKELNNNSAGWSETEADKISANIIENSNADFKTNEVVNNVTDVIFKAAPFVLDGIAVVGAYKGVVYGTNAYKQVANSIVGSLAVTDIGLRLASLVGDAVLGGDNITQATSRASNVLNYAQLPFNMAGSGVLPTAVDYIKSEVINKGIDVLPQIPKNPINKNEFHNSVTQNIEQNALGVRPKDYGYYVGGYFKYVKPQHSCKLKDNDVECE